MKRVALVLVIGNLLAGQGQTQQDGSHQPLTRVDCTSAGMTWDDTANVCAAAAAETRPGASALAAEVATSLSQPLTRRQCQEAGMTWDDAANVCSGQPNETAAELEPTKPEAVASTLLVNIDKAKQRMTVTLDGVQHYDWAVSTGLRGYTTPSGSYTARSMNKIWYSREWDNAPMPHAIFFTGKGHAIHGTEETKKLGRPASHGCVRLAPENARILFALVKEKGLESTQIVLAGTTPGGESKIATPGSRQHIKPSRSRVSKDQRLEQPRRMGRRGWFRRYAVPRRSPQQPFYMGRGYRGWR